VSWKSQLGLMATSHGNSLCRTAIMADDELPPNGAVQENGGLENDLWGGDDDEEPKAEEAEPLVNGTAAGEGDGDAPAEDAEQAVADEEPDADADMDLFGEYVFLSRPSRTRAKPNRSSRSAARRPGRKRTKIVEH
jgi:hypothetical protein